MNWKSRRFAVALGVVLFATAFAFGQKPVTEVKGVSFCELLQNPENYVGLQVRITAVYRYGFEWNELYCLECKKSVYVEKGGSYESLTPRRVRKKLKWTNDRGRTVKITAVGTISGSGNFGHMGRYGRKFVIDYVDLAEVILKDSPVILPERLRAKASCTGNSAN